MIQSFHGEFRWLSNFYPSPVYWAGVLYPTVEHAYQAAKSTDENERALIAMVESPRKAKKLGREIKHLDPKWELSKVDIMRSLLTNKFSHEPLRSMLLGTADEELVEGNTWGDTFWGECNGFGENYLGRLLMAVRHHLRTGHWRSL